MSLTMFQDDGSPCKFVTDEEKVRAAWEEVHIMTFPNDKPYSLVCGVEFVGTGPFSTLDELWAAAAKHLAERQQAIADVDEEIREAEFISLGSRSAVWKRILARLEAHRAELARGMKA